MRTQLEGHWDSEWLYDLGGRADAGALDPLTGDEMSHLRIMLPELGFAAAEIDAAMQGSGPQRAALVLDARDRVREASRRFGAALIALEERPSEEAVAEAIATLRDLALRSPIPLYRRMAADALRAHEKP